MRRSLIFWGVLGTSCVTDFAQTTVAGQTETPAHSYAVEAARNELPLIQYEGAYLRYKVHIVSAKGEQVRDVIESKDGTVARLLLKEKQPLTPQEDRDERARLQSMIDSPDAFAHHIKNDLSGKKLAAELIQDMPDAMLYEYAPGQPRRPDARPGGTADVVLDFTPNPSWRPPTLTSQALTGLRGRVWIDAKTHHVTRLEAEIFRGVSLGWGVLAHIDPGGKFALEQVEAAPQRWIFSHFLEDVKLRALMVKNITEHRQIDSSDFRQIPPMSYQDAIRTLLATPLPR